MLTIKWGETGPHLILTFLLIFICTGAADEEDLPGLLDALAGVEEVEQGKRETGHAWCPCGAQGACRLVWFLENFQMNSLVSCGRPRYGAAWALPRKHRGRGRRCVGCLVSVLLPDVYPWDGELGLAWFLRKRFMASPDMWRTKRSYLSDACAHPMKICLSSAAGTPSTRSGAVTCAFYCCCCRAPTGCERWKSCCWGCGRTPPTSPGRRTRRPPGSLGVGRGLHMGNGHAGQLAWLFVGATLITEVEVPTAKPGSSGGWWTVSSCIVRCQDEVLDIESGVFQP